LHCYRVVGGRPIGEDRLDYDRVALPWRRRSLSDSARVSCERGVRSEGARGWWAGRTITEDKTAEQARAYLGLSWGLEGRGQQRYWLPAYVLDLNAPKS